MTDTEITADAISFAKKNKKQISRKLTNKDSFPSELHPISVFMAGSPGAGKTESAKGLIQKFSNDSTILRIDSDELRCEFKEYSGRNSPLFQGATSIIAEKMQDMALKQKQSFVFDGTLSNLDKTIDNIKRSLAKDREVFVVYVYQTPLQAWEFVKRRAEKDGRIIPKDIFIDQYFAARSNVNKIKEIFKNDVKVDLIVKNIDGTDLKYNENITIIDNHIKEKYSKEDLRNTLS